MRSVYNRLMTKKNSKIIMKIMQWKPPNTKPILDLFDFDSSLNINSNAIQSAYIESTYLETNVQSHKKLTAVFSAFFNGTTTALLIPPRFQCTFITSRSAQTICCQWRIDVPLEYAKTSNVCLSSLLLY